MHSKQTHPDSETVMTGTGHADNHRYSQGERVAAEFKTVRSDVFLPVDIVWAVRPERMHPLGQRGINFAAQGFAVVNALVLAKVMLVAEDLNLGRWVRPRPLIYPILHESFLFTVLFICFHILEHVVIGLFHGETIAASIPAIGGGGFAGLLCVAVILFIALIPFFGFRAVSGELEPGRLNAMLFGIASAAGK
jgi:hypothetical protein